MNETRYKNGSSWVAPETAALRMSQWKECENCGHRFYRKGYQVPSLWGRQRFCSRECGWPKPIPMTLDRFMENVMPEPNSGCWLWMGSANKLGYGTVWDSGGHKKAYRVSWEFHNGPIPAGLSVCHHCDFPPCVNPDHLFLGTHQENIADMVKKGRQAILRGSSAGGAKLSESQALSIWNDDRTARVIAAEYGVSKSTVAAIKCGQNWGHLTGAKT